MEQDDITTGRVTFNQLEQVSKLTVRDLCPEIRGIDARQDWKLRRLGRFANDAESFQQRICDFIIEHKDRLFVDDKDAINTAKYLIDRVHLMQNFSRRNPIAYVLGYYVTTKSGYAAGDAINSKLLKKVNDFLLVGNSDKVGQIKDSSIATADVIRYARYWINTLGKMLDTDDDGTNQSIYDAPEEGQDADDDLEDY